MTSTSANQSDATVDRFKLLEQQQIQTSIEIGELKSTIGDLVSAMHRMVSDRTSTNSTPSTIQTETKQSESVHVQSKPASLSNTLINRDQVKHEVFESSKKLFGVSDSQLHSIDAFKQQAINQTFDLNESTIDMNETKLSDTVSSNPNNISFIQQLLPTATTTQPTLTELLQSGLKATAANHDRTKIKDVHKLLELLTEQAKSIIKSSEHDTSTCAASDYLMYTLNLMKLLFDFGLAATLEYHFALMKKVQANEAKLVGEHPMLFIEIASKYSRLPHTNVLQSVPISTAKPTSTGKFGRKSTPKFTGKPCEYHTKLLGKPANHSDAECRVAKQK
jgi:hypothetical protein